MRKILFIGLVVTAVVLVSGCYGPTTSPNATVQPTGGTPGEITPVITPVETVMPIETPIETATSVGISTVTETPVATATVTTIPMITAVSTVTGTATVSATVATVNITSAGYDPAIISVPSGTRVTWTNMDTLSHTVMSNTGYFYSPLDSGQSFSYTFSTPGSYDYSDSNNASMRGTVVVTS